MNKKKFIIMVNCDATKTYRYNLTTFVINDARNKKRGHNGVVSGGTVDKMIQRL